jgi:hypothetical protein
LQLIIRGAKFVPPAAVSGAIFLQLRAANMYDCGRVCCNEARRPLREDEREKYVVMCRGALHLILTADNYYVTQAFSMIANSRFAMQQQRKQKRLTSLLPLFVSRCDSICVITSSLAMLINAICHRTIARSHRQFLQLMPLFHWPRMRRIVSPSLFLFERTEPFVTEIYLMLRCRPFAMQMPLFNCCITSERT